MHSRKILLEENNIFNYNYLLFFFKIQIITGLELILYKNYYYKIDMIEFL